MALACSAGPRPSGRPATTTTITGLPVASSALTRSCWSGVSCGCGLSPSPSAYAFSPTATTTASADAAAATADALVGAYVTLLSSPLRPLSTVVPGGIWPCGPSQHTWPLVKGPCQLTLQPPTWKVMELAFGPVTTSLLDGDSGRALAWLRSSVIDSRAARSVSVRPAVTAASAALA